MSSERNLTPAEDALAELLVGAGLSYSEVGRRFGRSDKTIKAAVERAQAGESQFTNEQTAKAQAIVGFERWLERGRREGYLEALTAYLGGLETYKGRGGVGGVRTRHKAAGGS
jgi:IS30 family transposase